MCDIGQRNATAAATTTATAEATATPLEPMARTLAVQRDIALSHYRYALASISHSVLLLRLRCSLRDAMPSSPTQRRCFNGNAHGLPCLMRFYPTRPASPSFTVCTATRHYSFITTADNSSIMRQTSRRRQRSHPRRLAD